VAQKHAKQLYIVLPYLYPDLIGGYANSNMPGTYWHKAKRRADRERGCDYYLQHDGEFGVGKGTYVVWLNKDIPKPTDKELADAKKPAMFWAWWKLLKQTRDKFLKDSYKYQVISNSSLWKEDGVYRVFDGVSCFITSEDKLNEYREKLKNLHNTVIPPSWDVLENMPRPVWERDIIKFMPTLKRENK